MCSAPAISTRALADLARAGLVLTRHTYSEVVYEIRHLVDSPGALFGLIGEEGASPARPTNPDAAATDEYLETLSVGSNGVGLIVRTGVRQVGNSAGKDDSDAPKVDGRGAVVFSGAAQPNPSFLYSDAGVIEGVISVDEIDAPVEAGHGQDIRELAQLVADCALDIGAPILLLQSPTQHPYRYREAGAASITDHKIAPASSVALRFGIAAGHSRVTQRLDVLARIAARCATNGYGMWITDPRPGHRSGNWFQVCEPNVRAMALRRASGLSEPGSEAASVCPLTFVGPARVGTTGAVLDMLSMFPPANVVGLSVTSLDDLAFIHVQLAGFAAKRSTCPTHSTLTECYQAAVRRGSSGVEAAMSCLGIAPVDSARRHDGSVLTLSAARSRLDDVAGDYRMVWGPTTTRNLVPETRRGVWISWEYDRAQGGLRVPLDGLSKALSRLGLMSDRPRSRSATTWAEQANIEYLICRYVGERTLRGKAKLSVPAAWLRTRYPGDEQTRAVRMLAAELERAWRGVVDPEGESSRELTVAWLEFWLGHWSSTTV